MKLKSTISIDFETRSACDLRKSGVYVYAVHPTTDAMCLAYAFGDAPVKLWRLGDPPPHDLFEAIAQGAHVYAWNFQFEKTMWDLLCVPKYGWPPLPLEQGYCTMAMAYALALPGSLDGASQALGIDFKKDMAGNRGMMQLSQPREVLEDGRVIWWDPAHAKSLEDLSAIQDKFEKLWAYCKQDVEVERATAKRMLPLNEMERKLWLLDQKINARGVMVDIPAAKGALQIVEFEKKRLGNEMRAISNNEISSPNSLKDIAKFFQDHGIMVEDFAKQDVLDLLEIESLPEICRDVLRIRQLASRTSTAKIDAMVNAAGADGRLRGMFQYHGANTGRWAGRLVQLHNLLRGKLKDYEVDALMELFRKVAA